MANSTTNLDLKMEYYDTVVAKIKTSEVLVVDGFSAIAPATGLLENIGTTTGSIPVGLVVGSTSGKRDTDGLTGDATIKAVVKSGRMIERVAVTGTTAISDYGKWVYATDNQTYSLTKPTAAVPVGWVKLWHSTTICDVQLLTSSELIMAGFIPQTDQILMGYATSQSLGGAAAANLLLITAQRRMKLVSLVAYPNIDDGVAAGAQTFTVEIGAVDCTGTMALANTDCNALADLGVAVTQALSGAVTANQGDIITLKLVTGGTGFTDDMLAGFTFFLNVEYLPGS